MEQDINPLLLEQYKLYVEMTDKVSSRRIEASKFYISILTALLVVITFAIDKETPLEIRRIVFLLIGFLGLLLCFVWVINIRSYKQLNSLRFKVIHELEEKLPFPLFTREWEILKEEKETRTYRRLSKVEQYVPFILGIPYFLMFIYGIIS